MTGSVSKQFNKKSEGETESRGGSEDEGEGECGWVFEGWMLSLWGLWEFWEGVEIINKTRGGWLIMKPKPRVGYLSEAT